MTAAKQMVKRQSLQMALLLLLLSQYSTPLVLHYVLHHHVQTILTSAKPHNAVHGLWEWVA